jgi:fido (protein-threonine AMPylation protein)
MANFVSQAQEACRAFEEIRKKRSGKESEAALLARFVQVLCDLLNQFLLIHPFANGNGHVARLLVWVLATRHGFPPTTWPLDGRPPYAAALMSYRDGDRRPLMALLLSHMM